MQSIIDISTAACEAGGIKRAASPPFPCLSSSMVPQEQLPQDEMSCLNDHVCYYKRLRTSDPCPSMKSRNTHTAFTATPPSILWRDFRKGEDKTDEEAQRSNHGVLNSRDRMSNSFATTATPFASTQHSNTGIEPPWPGASLKPQGRLHNFFTNALINTSLGVVDVERVQVDARSPFNLIPRSIVANLDLVLYSGKTLTITVAHHLIQIKQYSHFTIRVAGHDTTINAGVITGLQTILLGREWMRSVHLLSDFGNRKYYIPTPLVVEIAGEKVPEILDNEFWAKDIKSLETATLNETAEERVNDKLRKTYCGGGDSSNGQSSPDDGSYPKPEPSFDGQNSLDVHTSSNKPILGNQNLSHGGTPIERRGEHDVRPTDDETDEDDSGEEDEEVSDDEDDSEEEVEKVGDDEDDSEEEVEKVGDDEDDSEEEVEKVGDDEDDSEDDGEEVGVDGTDDRYHGNDGDNGSDDVFSEDCEDYKCHEGKVCDHFEGCEECDGCEECEKCEVCDAYEEHEEFGEGREDPNGKFMEQYIHLERVADPEIHRPESESKDELACFSSPHVVRHEQAAILDPTRPQANEDQGRITKWQFKHIADILNHISRTQAGQSFKAPVEQLWPEFADAYAARVPNPIDLGTIQAKLKNNMYSSVDDFRADIILLYQNSADFNGIDHIITSTALEVRDTILNALNDIEDGKGGMMLKA